MLVFPQHVFDDIERIVNEKHGLETGVSLFGIHVRETREPSGAPALEPPAGGDHLVLAVAGPGPAAAHHPFRYSSDGDYSTGVYWALQSALPAIQWLGELHVHPQGMTWLSGRDRENVREILLDNDDTLHPEEFIAGVMQREIGGVGIYPYLFSRDELEGKAMSIARVSSNAPTVQEARQIAIGGKNGRPGICEEPERGRGVIDEAPRHRRTWKFWKRFGAHGDKSGSREVHAH